MKETRVALDIDDVLAGFSMKIHEINGKDILPHDHWSLTESTGILIVENEKPFKYKDSYLKLEENPDFWMSLDPIQSPRDIKFNVFCYLTSSPVDMVLYRYKWLLKFGFPAAPVIHSKEKANYMLRHGITHIVDDRKKTIDEVNSVDGLTGVHFKPWFCNVEVDNQITNLKDFKI